MEHWHRSLTVSLRISFKEQWLAVSAESADESKAVADAKREGLGQASRQSNRIKCVPV